MSDLRISGYCERRMGDERGVHGFAEKMREGWVNEGGVHRFADKMT